METNQIQQQVDPTALALSRSIRHAEGGDYNNVSGDNGTSAGAYQWNNGKIPLKKGEIPANFKSAALRYKLSPDDFSQENQDHVAYSEIKGDLDSGLSQSQIAAKWNSGLTHGWENHKGSTTINGKTISYNTPAYVEKVKREYLNQMNGSGTSDNTEVKSGGSIAPKQKTFEDIIETSPNAPSENKGILGTNKNDSLYGKVLDNSITKGIVGVGNALSFGGAKQLGEQTGSSLATIGEKVKGLVGGKDNSKYVPENTLKPKEILDEAKGHYASLRKEACS